MIPLEQKFWRFVQKTDSCWLWTGRVGSRGKYGQITHLRKNYMAHRLSMALHGKSIPKGLVADHICRNSLCVNPEHLRAVPMEINSLENSSGVGALNIIKTHCIHGHEFTPENTRILTRADGRKLRQCKECQRRWDRESYWRHKELG